MVHARIRMYVCIYTVLRTLPRRRLGVDGVAHALTHHEVADLVGARAPPAGRPRLLRGAAVLAVEADGARQRQQRPGQRAAQRRSCRHHRGCWGGGAVTAVRAERALVHHPRRPPPASPPQAVPHQAPHGVLRRSISRQLEANNQEPSLGLLDLISLSLFPPLLNQAASLSALSLSTSLRARALPISKQLGLSGHAARAMSMAPPTRLASLCGRLLPCRGHAIVDQSGASQLVIYIKERCRELVKWWCRLTRLGWKQATCMADVYMEGQGGRKRRGR